MVQVKYIGSIMSISRCDRCGGRAIIIGADGSWRCVICSPKEYKWNKEKMKYE
mgnify:FL=1